MLTDCRYPNILDHLRLVILPRDQGLDSGGGFAHLRRQGRGEARYSPCTPGGGGREGPASRYGASGERWRNLQRSESQERCLRLDAPANASLHSVLSMHSLKRPQLHPCPPSYHVGQDGVQSQRTRQRAEVKQPLT